MIIINLKMIYNLNYIQINKNLRSSKKEFNNVDSN